ncbi:MAG TPA: GxxExxY protein [Pyrinomonadaceae bacterium]|nr:GxxExxY protein [Pyrinomonadaceae bacterium]
MEILHKELSYKIVGLAMKLHTELGYGFLEKVYENALMILLRENGIKAEQQVPIKVYYHGQIVGDYIADILVEDNIILELKSSENLAKAHKAQTINYLKATNLRLAMLLNFGKSSLEHERIVL